MTCKSFTVRIMAISEPKWRRRKDARPAEIIEAALSVFAENGFAAAKLEDIARRAGIAKSSLYLYFETKEDLFRAGVRSAIVPGFDDIRSSAESFTTVPVAQLLPGLLARAASIMTETRLPAVVKIVIGESRNFPDLARLWQDEVVSPIFAALTLLIQRAQARGEIQAGDPRVHAFSLVGPLFMGMMF